MEDKVASETLNYGILPSEAFGDYDSGLSVLRAIIAGRLPHAPISETLGFLLTEADPNRAVFAGTPRLHHYNPFGAVHAGFAATLLDSAMFCSVVTTFAKGESATTLELKINLVGAITDKTGPVRAEGRVIHRGRTTATAEGYLRDEDGRLYAHGTTTCIIFRAK